MDLEIKNIIRKLSIPTVTFFVGILLAVIASQVLAHGGDTSFIHSCVKTSNGSVRIVGPNDTCNNNETALDWPGSSGITGYEIISVSSIRDGEGTPKTVTTNCPAGKKALGGGIEVGGTVYQPYTLTSRPISDGQGWTATVLMENSEDWFFDLYVTCANAQ